AVPAVTTQRSAVPSSCVSGGSSGSTIRTFALELNGALNNREFATFFASLFFHRFWMSSLVQKAVLLVGALGIAAWAPPRPPWVSGAATAVWRAGRCGS